LCNLKIKRDGANGRTFHITPENAGWRYVGFDLYRLAPGESVREATGGREVCLVLVSGRARVAAAGHDFGAIGERTSPFEGKPWSVYAPAVKGVASAARSSPTRRRPGSPAGSTIGRP
jgi:5-deoxy-glucuronate isomerase